MLRVISSSPSELDPVFKKMLDNATRVCNAEFGSMVLQERGEFRWVAEHNQSSELAELMRRATRLCERPLTVRSAVSPEVSRSFMWPT